MLKLTEGHDIAQYRIVRLLGEGGMGAVYEAMNDTIERRVAIKVLHPQYAKNPEVTLRFFNEARAVNRIEHPSIVQVSDYAQLPDCTAYIVMEFLKGESLASRIHRGPLPCSSALHIAWQIAEALSAAHAKGIVHRDLKPHNVMLVCDPVAPGGERAKILDFGIAKLTQEQSQGTATNALLGTPQYMSPEQCRGAGGVDDKTDVYALGVMLYEMLAGRRPFVAIGHGELISMHLREEPTPLGELAPHVPEAVVVLVHRLLAKDRRQRPSMHEVLSGLRELSTAPHKCVTTPLWTLEASVISGLCRREFDFALPCDLMAPCRKALCPLCCHPQSGLSFRWSLVLTPAALPLSSALASSCCWPTGSISARLPSGWACSAALSASGVSDSL